MLSLFSEFNLIVNLVRRILRQQFSLRCELSVGVYAFCVEGGSVMHCDWLLHSTENSTETF